MKTFNVQGITKTYNCFDVEAESEEIAKEIVSKMLANGKVSKAYGKTIEVVAFPYPEGY